MLTVLVTGAGGLIGGEVCARLAARGHRVLALTHRSPAVLGNDGQVVSTARVLAGDVRREGLGIAGPFEAPDLVIHCAASLVFDAPREELDAINVEGTRQVVDFARSHGASLLHVSTAYVCGTRDGPIAEKPVPDGTEFANGYEASKAEAEAVVRASGVPHCIARPAIVLGDSKDGAIRKFDSMYQAFALIARGLLRTMPVRDYATLDFVPIDHVAGGIVALAETMDAADGAICHLTSGSPLPVTDFARAIAAYPQFQQPTLTCALAFDPACLAPAQRRIFRKVAGAYGSYFQRDPRFDDRQFRALTGSQCPPTGLEWMARLIDFAIAGGLLPDASDTASIRLERKTVIADSHRTSG